MYIKIPQTNVKIINLPAASQTLILKNQILMCSYLSDPYISWNDP